MFEGRAHADHDARQPRRERSPRSSRSTSASSKTSAPGAGDPAERIKDMDLDGVDAEVLYVGGPLQSADRRAEASTACAGTTAGCRTTRRTRRVGCSAWRRSRSTRPSVRSRRSASPPRSPASPAVTSRCSRPRATTATTVEPDVGGVPRDRRMPIGLHVGGRRPGTPTVNIYESAPRFMTGLVMSKLTMAESVVELINGLVMQRYPELKFIVGRGPDRLDLVLPVLLGPPLGEAPLLDQERAHRAAELLLPAPGVRHVHGGPRRSARARSTSASTTSCGRATTRTPRPRGRTRKALTDEWFTPFGDEDKAKILWKNCAKLYGLV